MGYYGITCYQRDRRGRPNRKATLDTEFTGTDGTIIRSTMRGTVYYGIWQSATTGDYAIIVAPTHISEDDELFYKPLSEDMGPVYYSAPRSYIEFLEKHAPIEGDGPGAVWAREWRRKCLEHADEVRARRRFRNERRRRYKAWLEAAYAS